jgi:hypothetical protein
MFESMFGLCSVLLPLLGRRRAMIEVIRQSPKRLKFWDQNLSVNAMSSLGCCIYPVSIFIGRTRWIPRNAHSFSIKKPLSTSTAHPHGICSRIFVTMVCRITDCSRISVVFYFHGVNSLSFRLQKCDNYPTCKSIRLPGIIYL